MMIGSFKNDRENYRRKCLRTQEKETQVKFNPFEQLGPARLKIPLYYVMNLPSHEYRDFTLILIEVSIFLKLEMNK